MGEIKNKITEVYAYVAYDERRGEEGIVVAKPTDGKQVLLMLDSLEYAEKVKDIVKRIAKNTDTEIKLVKFTYREEIEVIR
jgi:hypothetical protein